MADLKATAKVRGITATGSVSRPSGSGRVSGSVPLKQDYFQWRQETFEPLHHWPMQDSEAATVSKPMTESPVLTPIDIGSTAPSERALVRPAHRYRSWETSQWSGADGLVADGYRFSWIHQTGVFTIVAWIHTGNDGVGVQKIIANADHGDEAGFDFWCRGSNFVRANTLSFRTAQGGSMGGLVGRGNSILGGRSHHVAAVGDGDTVTAYRDGASIESAPFEADNRDAEASHDLHVMQAPDDNRPIQAGAGFIVDDRPWTADEIRADYERGLSVLHPHDGGDW